MAAWRRFILRRVRAHASDMLAVITLLGAAILFHSPAWSRGLIPIEDDVKVFYFPLLVATSKALAHHSLVLWTPSIFGGYPLFADGESGMLYPIHLLFLWWMSPEVSIVVLRIVHSFLAGAFTLALVRTLGGRPLSGVIAGLVYAYSGFAAGQIIHTNVFQGMVWLPLELLFVERACRARGIGRARYAALAGAVVGMQALALHINVTIMSGLAIGFFVAYRSVILGFEANPLPALVDAGARGRARQLGWVAVRLTHGALVAIGILAIVGVVGVALSAVQLLPLYELADLTVRGGPGLDDAHASINTIWPGGFITALLPRLFDTTGGGYWAPWVKWETNAYVGLLPLLLALIGVITRTGRHLLFFVGLAVISVLISLGPGSPVPLWELVHHLPELDGLKSPGRFMMLGSLAVAVLAAYGADWLAGFTPRDPLHGVLRATLVLMDGMLLVLAVDLGLQRASDTLRAIASGNGNAIDWYLHLRGMPATVDGAPLTDQRVAQLASYALSPLNPPALGQIAILATGVLIVTLWVLGAAMSPGRLRRAAPILAIGLITADLFAITLSFHPYGAITDLRPRLPSVLTQAGTGPYRVYTPPTADEKRTQVEPNRLLVAGLEEANGYSSLEPDEHAAYVDAVQYSDTQLLDLWNVRFVVKRVAQLLLPSYAGVSFYPDRPLVSGNSAAMDETFIPEGGDARASGIRVVSRLWSAMDVPQDTVVATVRIQTAEGSVIELPMRAGEETADTGVDVPSSTQAFKHKSGEVAFQYQRINPDGPNYGFEYFIGRLVFPTPTTVSRVTVHLAGNAALEVFGMGLVDPVTSEVTEVRDKAKYKLVYQDSQIRVYENADPLPRAFLVANAEVNAPGRTALGRMRDGGIDLRHTALLSCSDACPPEGAIPRVDPIAAEPPTGTATIAKYGADGMTVHTSAAASSVLVVSNPFYPGWKARIDGDIAPIIRTDWMFQGVVVPAGEHTVSFSFEPHSVALGAATTVGMAGLLLAFFAIPELERARRRLANPARWRVAVPFPKPAPEVAAASAQGEAP